MSVVDTPIWQALQIQAVACAEGLNLARVLKDSKRFEHLSLHAPHVLLDCSKCLWDEAVLGALLQLAEAAGVESQRDALYAAEVVNVTEQRPALHVHLRAWGAIAQEAEDGCCAGLRERARFTDVLHISIGGSGLGPELVLQAQQPWCVGGRHVHVVSNMDGHDLLSKSWFTAGLLSACMLDAASEANSCAAYSEAI